MSWCFTTCYYIAMHKRINLYSNKNTNILKLIKNIYMYVTKINTVY